MVAGTRKRPPHSHAASEKLNSVVRVVQTGPPGTFCFSFAFTGAYVLAEPLVQIRPPQPKNSFLSAISTNPATIRIDNPPPGRGIDKLGSLRVPLKAVLTPDVT